MLTYFPQGNDVEKEECAVCGFDYRKSALKKQDGMAKCPDCYERQTPNPERRLRPKFTEFPGRIV